MIHVDAERLTSHRAFKERLAAKVAAIPAPDVVLAPRHSAATDLARQVATLVGLSDPVICDPDSLNELPFEWREKLIAAERVLIVDDVIVTGNRLHSYRQHLREGGFLSSEFPRKLHVLIAVARAPTTEILASVHDMVHGEDQFHDVENIVLPDWRADRCPWCWEADLLERHRDQIARNPKLAQRLDALSRPEHGIRDGLFLPWNTEVPSHTFELGPGSIFAGTDQIDLFVGVASAMQNLRAGGKLDERYTLPLAKVLKPEFVQNRYYDPVIYASIVRCAHRHDLRGAATTEPALAEMLANRLHRSNTGDRGIRAELILAMARGVLPMQVDLTTDTGLLTEIDGTPEVRDLLRAAVTPAS